MKNLIVNEKYDNKKLINFLQDNIPNLSNSLIYKTLRKKDIKINNKRVSENCLLKRGDEIKVYIADNLLEQKLDIPIVYEDTNIIIFDKPTNLEVTGNDSLSSYAQKKYGTSVQPCHRLDRNTSGLVLFAKNNESLTILLDAFKNHHIEKHYQAIVYGIPKNNFAKLESYLFKDSKKALVYISDKPLPKYQKIITYYRVVKNDLKKNISLLDVTLETGKTHQIRAHLAHIGLPLVGDGKYGINKINKEFKQKNQLLCSYSLTFSIKKNCLLSYLDGQTISKAEQPFINLI